jgi:hypothetical protein
MMQATLRYYRHHTRMRVIQYSRADFVSHNRRGVLDARLRGHDSD